MSNLLDENKDLDFIKHESDFIFNNNTKTNSKTKQEIELDKLLAKHNYINDNNNRMENENDNKENNEEIYGSKSQKDYDNNENSSLKKELKSNEIIYKIKMQNQEALIIKPLQTGSFYSTLLFSIFSTLGSGIIILPITMHQLGIIWATLLFIICAFISYFTLYQLVIEAYNNNMYYFSDLVEFKYGKRVLIFVEICFHICNLLGVTVFNKVSKKVFILSNVFYSRYN